MEIGVPDWAGYLLNLGGLGLLIGLLLNDRKAHREDLKELRKEVKEVEAIHQKALEEKDKQINSLMEHRITAAKEVTSIVAASNNVIAANGAVLERATEVLEKIEGARK